MDASPETLYCGAREVVIAEVGGLAHIYPGAFLVQPDGPAAYFSTLPLRAMLAAVQAAGVPVELSLSAGAYLCNQVLYTLLHTCPIPGGFIHLPSLPEQVTALGRALPSMGLAESQKAVRAALAAIASL